MENRWLPTLLLAPFLSRAAMAVESYSLYWSVLELDVLSTTGERDQPDPIENSLSCGAVQLETPIEATS